MNKKQQEQDIIQAAWNKINIFRMKHFFSDTTAVIEIGEFDSLLEDIQKLFQ